MWVKNLSTVKQEYHWYPNCAQPAVCGARRNFFTSISEKKPVEDVCEICEEIFKKESEPCFTG